MPRPHALRRPVPVSLLTSLVGAALAAATVVAPSAGAAEAPARPATTAAAPATTQAPVARYLVRLADGDQAAGSRLAALLRTHGGRVVGVHESVATAVVDVTPAVVARIAGTAGVLGVSPDGGATLTSLTSAPPAASAQPGSMTNVTRLTGARAAWRAGYTGRGVDVAVIDTGVAPVPALAHRTKVVVGPDLSFESQAPELRHLDTYGHGTHMAGIIAGREAAPASGAAYAADEVRFAGMAPDARIVSVKVGDRNGAVDVSQLIAAIDWVVQHRRHGDLDIRVLNLSFGTDSRQSYVVDPLSHAAEVAWRKGIFVVASAGNDGRSDAGLASPAYNANIAAVGAVDTRGTDTRADDVVPEFSQHPNATRYQREPDVVAPGVGIEAPAVPGSAIHAAHPGARVGDDLIRGSGTSQAAAVVSGAAALLVSKWPAITPAQIKELLGRTATSLPGTLEALQGEGELDIAAALRSSPMPLLLLSTAMNHATSRPHIAVPRAIGTGSLEKARGSGHVSIDGVELRGETDILSGTWRGPLIGPLTDLLRMWSPTGAFNGNRWTGDGFTSDTASWAGRTWAGRTWAGRTWAGVAWSGRTWAGRTWAGGTWNGAAWTGADWPTVVRPGGFSGHLWSSASWG